MFRDLTPFEATFKSPVIGEELEELISLQPCWRSWRAYAIKVMSTKAFHIIQHFLWHDVFVLRELKNCCNRFDAQTRLWKLCSGSMIDQVVSLTWRAVIALAITIKAYLTDKFVRKNENAVLLLFYICKAQNVLRNFHQPSAELSCQTKRDKMILYPVQESFGLRKVSDNKLTKPSFERLLTSRRRSVLAVSIFKA